VGRLVAAAAAGDKRHAARPRHAGAYEDGVARQPAQAAEGDREALDHLLDHVLGAVDELLHEESPSSGSDPCRLVRQVKQFNG
jgi:hypothetical protein